MFRSSFFVISKLLLDTTNGAGGDPADVV